MSLCVLFAFLRSKSHHTRHEQGDIDIISGNAHPETGYLRIHFNSNDGTFTKDNEIIVYRDADAISSVVAADIDQDGNMDLVASSWFDTSLRWFRNSNGLANNFTDADVKVVSPS